MAIYSVSVPIDVLHKLYSSQEYVSLRADGDNRGVAAGTVLRKIYDEFRTTFDIYSNPAAFLSTRKFMLKCRWIHYLYPRTQPGWNWGSTAMDRYISIMLERHYATQYNTELKLAPYDQDMNRAYSIPTITYYKFVESEESVIDIEDIVTKAMVHFLAKYPSFTSNHSTRNIKVYIDDIRWEEIMRWKGYGDSAIDHWIAFALEDYILDTQNDSEHK